MLRRLLLRMGFFWGIFFICDITCFAAKKTQWLLLRGLSREHRHWDRFPEDLQKALGPDAEIIMIDFPGTGEYINEVSPTTIQEITDFVRVKLPPAKELVERHVLALSMGGMVAMDWLDRFPNEFASAVLVGTSHKFYSPWHQRIDPRSLARGMAGVLTGDFMKDVRRQERAFLDITCNNPECRKRVEDEWIKIQEHDPVRTSTIIRQLFAAAIFEPPLNRPRAPILLIHGQDDRIASVECSKALAKAWGVKLLIRPKAGHDVPLEAGPWVASQVAHWMTTAKQVSRH